MSRSVFSCVFLLFHFLQPYYIFNAVSGLIKEVGGRDRQISPAVWKRRRRCRPACKFQSTPALFPYMAQKCRLILPLGEGKTSGELRRKRRRYFPFSGNISAHFYHIVPQRRERPLCSGPLPCNSPASRHEREFSPFPFAAYLLREIALQWLTFVHTAYKKPLWCILAPTVPFAWGFSPRSFKAGT